MNTLIALCVSIVFFFVLFLCVYLVIKQFKIYEHELKESEQVEINCLKNVELLRKESLESYRKGLFDGISINKNNPLVVDHNPIKTIKEHESIIEKNEKQSLAEEEQIKADKLYQDGINRLMNYTGGDEDAENN